MPDRDAPTGKGPPFDPFASPARTRALVEQLPVVVYVDTDELRHATVYIGPNVEQMTGHRPDEVIADPDLWMSMVHPDDRDRVWREWEDAWTRGTPYRAEYRIARPDGEVTWVRDSSMLVKSDEGQRLAWQGVLQDLTTEKRSEEHTRASEARYRALVERVPAVVYEMDPDDERRTLYVSPHVEEVLGYTRAEWLDQPDIWIELLHADDREVVLAHHDRHSETGEPWDLEYRLIANDGRVVWVHDRATLIRGRDGGSAAWHGVMIDVTAEREAKEMLLLHKEDLERRVAERTNELSDANELMALEIGERRRMEMEVRRVEERYRRLVENMPGIAYVGAMHPDGDRTFTYLSPRVQDVLGFAPDGFDASGRIHPHDRARVVEAVSGCARTGERFLLQYRLLARDGRVVWILDSASLISRTDAGDPATFQGVMLDITERKEAESKAEEAEDRFRTLTERGPVVAYSFSVEHPEDGSSPSIRVSYLSPQAADLVRHPVERWIRDPSMWLDMMHPDDRERVAAVGERSRRTGEPWTIRYRMIRPDGTFVWLLDTGRMVDRDALGRPSTFQGVLLDVTEDEEAKARVAASERSQREALEGTLAIPWTETVHPETGFEHYTYIGPQAYDVLGYRPEELIAERAHFRRMVHPDDREGVEATIERAERTGIWEATYRILRRDGEVRRLHSFGRRASAPGVVPELWHGVAVDVTAARSTAADEGAADRTADRER